VKTEYSRDSVPLDTAVVKALMLHKERSFSTPDGWLFANPVTGRPYHQEEIQKTHIRRAGVAAGIGGDIGWHTFRHSYRSWLDETGAPLTVQKELMRHSSIQTTMNIYGKTMTDSKRQAHSKVVEMVLNSSKSKETIGRNNPVAAIGSFWGAHKSVQLTDLVWLRGTATLRTTCIALPFGTQSNHLKNHDVQCWVKPDRESIVIVTWSVELCHASTLVFEIPERPIQPAAHPVEGGLRRGLRAACPGPQPENRIRVYDALVAD
jgi:hypothetical protein